MHKTLKHTRHLILFLTFFQIIYAKIKGIKYVMSLSILTFLKLSKELLTSWCTVLNIYWAKWPNIIKYNYLY